LIRNVVNYNPSSLRNFIGDIARISFTTTQIVHVWNHHDFDKIKWHCDFVEAPKCNFYICSND